MLVQRGLGIPLFAHADLLALTPSDIDFEKKTLTVNKSYQRLGREDIITTSKTPKSNRTIPIPDGLCTCLQEYMSYCYGLQKDDRLFPYTKSFLYHEMEYGCKASGVKCIRVHDIRHSHASLLVEMGFSPLLIAERLGHEKVQTTMDTYSHLYPNKQVQLLLAGRTCITGAYQFPVSKHCHPVCQCHDLFQSVGHIKDCSPICLQVLYNRKQ